MRKLHWKYIKKILYVLFVFGTSTLFASLFLDADNVPLALLWLFLTVAAAVIPLNLPKATDDVRKIEDD
jgi:magnesium-transporting ATPase (P-type)